MARMGRPGHIARKAEVSAPPRASWGHPDVRREVERTPCSTPSALSSTLDPFDQMVEGQSSILGVSFGVPGRPTGMPLTGSGTGSMAGFIRFAVGNHDDLGATAKLGLFQSEFELNDVEVAGQQISLCHHPMRP